MAALKSLTEEYLIETFCTQARVHKHAVKLALDRGVLPSMDLMSDLITRVADDILAEEVVGLSYNREVSAVAINFRKFRNGLAPIIRETLETILVNRPLDVLEEEETVDASIDA